MSKTKKTDTYYAVAGVNAYGVYTDFIKAEESACYIRKCKIEPFTNFDAAKRWATERLLFLQPPMTVYVNIDPIESLNWCYHKNK